MLKAIETPRSLGSSNSTTGGGNERYYHPFDDLDNINTTMITTVDDSVYDNYRGY